VIKSYTDELRKDAKVSFQLWYMFFSVDFGLGWTGLGYLCILKWLGVQGVHNDFSSNATIGRTLLPSSVPLSSVVPQKSPLLIPRSHYQQFLSRILKTTRTEEKSVEEGEKHTLLEDSGFSL
jgi:hypothetical protein